MIGAGMDPEKTGGGLPPLMPDLFEPLAEPGRYGLVGSRCRACGCRCFPLDPHCPKCQGGMDREVVGTHGKVYSFTVVCTKAPFGLPEPYAVGYVDLAESSLRVFGLLDPAAIGSLEVGMPVEVTVMPLGVDKEGRRCLRPVFRAWDGVHERSIP
jgi:uncharacterized OB-fold protein